MGKKRANAKFRFTGKYDKVTRKKMGSGGQGLTTVFSFDTCKISILFSAPTPFATAFQETIFTSE